VKNGAVPQPFRWGMAKSAPRHFLAVQGHWAHFISLCFVCMYLWQHKNIEFLPFLCVQRDKKGCVQRFYDRGCFDLIKYVSTDIGMPYDAKVPLTAYVKGLYDEWLSWCRWMLMGTWFPIFRQVQDNYRFGRRATHRSGFRSQRPEHCNLSTTSPLVINCVTLRLTSPWSLIPAVNRRTQARTR
jgi:hypothetical protein